MARKKIMTKNLGYGIGGLTLAAIIANGLHWYKVKNISPMALLDGCCK